MERDCGKQQDEASLAPTCVGERRIEIPINKPHDQRCNVVQLDPHFLRLGFVAFGGAVVPELFASHARTETDHTALALTIRLWLTLASMTALARRGGWRFGIIELSHHGEVILLPTTR